MSKEAYIVRYRELIKAYFNDGTEQGRIAKYARMQEAEYILENILNVSHDAVRDIYNEEYRRSREEEKHG